MSKSRHTEAQIIGVLKQLEAGRKAEDVARESSLGVPMYNYNSSNELTSNSNGSYTYDANGNTLSAPQGRVKIGDRRN